MPKSSATAPRPKQRGLARHRDHDFLNDQLEPAKLRIIRTIDKPSHLIIDLDRPSE